MSAAINGRLGVLVFLFSMPLFAFSQDGSSSTAPGPTLRTEVRLVVVDVVVLDPQGMCTGLQRDFHCKASLSALSAIPR